MQFTTGVVDLRDWIRHHDRVRQVAVGVVIVLAVMLLKVAVKSVSGSDSSYVLLAGAIAAATWWGGWPGGVAATITAGLSIQWLTRPADSAIFIVDGSSLLLFVAESLCLVLVVARLRLRLMEAISRLQSADVEIIGLRRREQDLQLIEQAFDACAANLRENACLLLDAHGRVTRWNSGAERMFGHPESSVVGEAWPALGAADGSGDPELLGLPGASRTAAPAVGVGSLTTAEGRRFHGELTVSPLRDKRGVVQGFMVLVRDLTNEQASEAFRSQAIAAHEVLQGESDTLAHQLETIQSVLDPELSDLLLPALLGELSGRVLVALDVDGVAIVGTRLGTNGTVFTAARGIQAELKRGARPALRRLRIIQNDVVRAREGSAVSWPEAVGLLVTVPLSHQKRSLGALEVVTRRARRWTERDAIVLLLAADRAAAALAGAKSHESAEPAPTTLDGDRMSLPQ